MRRAAKVDTTQQAIVKALRDIGATVQSLSAVGHGVPDLLIGWRGLCFLLECKTERKQGGRGLELTQEEKRWHQQWSGHIAIVSEPEQAVQTVIAAAKSVGRV